MKYEPGDIVIVETHDAFRGKVRVPAIITSADEEHHAYEVRVLFPLHDTVRTVFGFWTITEDEIAAWLGKAGIEK